MSAVEALGTAASLLDALGIMGILQGAMVVGIAMALASKLLRN